MDASDPWGCLTEALLGTPAFTPLDVAQQAGVDPAEARRLWLALGFPPVSDDEHVFTQADVEIVRAVRALVELHSANREDLLQLARVIGQSLARVADAEVTAAAGRLERLHGETPSDDAAVDAVIRRMEALAPSLEQFLDEHIPERGGRVVKMIGDEVMFASDEVGRAADIALALAEAYARDADVPEVRVGLASGPTLAWEGDLYGPSIWRVVS
jgi:adenylate cyclase